MSQDILSPYLVASPEPQNANFDISEGFTTSTRSAIGQDGYNEFTIYHQDETPMSAQQLRDNRAKINQTNDVHPYVQTLSISNLESCVALENAVFPEEERCSREKVRVVSALI